MQQWTKYTEWEDWVSGMWRKVDEDTEMKLLQLAINYAGNYIAYKFGMKLAVEKWPRTMLNSLSSPSVNKRAFIGHCACQLVHNIPEYITRKAWFLLTEGQRILADKEAQKIYNKWKKNYLNTLKNGNNDAIMKGYQMKAR